MTEPEGQLTLAGDAPRDRDDRVAQAIARATQYLLAQQHARGQWQAPLEADASMEAEYVFFNHLLQREKPEFDGRLTERLLALQGADGGWPLWRGGPPDLSTTVEAYAALRLLGLGADEPALARARGVIRAAGGPAGVRVFTRIWLACLGQYPWEGVPSLPVELVLLPPWAPISITVFSRLRSTVVPLALLLAHRSTVRLPSGSATAELWPEPPRRGALALPRSAELLTVQNAVALLERGVRRLQGASWQPLRRRAVARAIEWILRHQDASGQWSGTLSATLASVLALDAVGFARDHPAIVSGLHGADDFLLECGGTLAVQPATAPTRDTALAVRALLDAGVEPGHDALARAGEWLLGAQVFQPGDWAVLNPRLDPGGWPATPADDAYPAVDISACVLAVLAELPVAGTPAGRRALAYGCNWTLGMQSRGGGYATFDVDNAVALPLPGLDSPIDAPAADVTGRALELMAAVGYGMDFGRARAAVAFLRRSQRADGSWPGRWGVNAVYGTADALAGLVAIGEDRGSQTVRAGVGWLAAHQNADGGWGDTPASYADPTLAGTGDSTPSQTAWALLGLLAAGGEPRAAVERGVDWLVRAQGSDGTWAEAASTGTALPGRLYLRRHIDRHAFPLMALARAARER